MKSFKLLVLFLLFTVSSLWGQAPGFINYQSAFRQSDGAPMSNQEINCLVRIEVGNQLFVENYSGFTDGFGVLNLQIGGLELKDLDWSQGNAKLIVEFDNPTLNYNDTVFIAAVPYALYAESSGSSIPGPAPAHEWDGTRIRFENPDGTFGEWKELMGPEGTSVKVVGSVPTPDDLPSGENNSTGDLIFIESNGDGYVWNGEEWVNLGRIQGPRGDRGLRGERGEKGDKPQHQWSGTELRFEHPDGTFGNFVNLRGSKGDQGDQGAPGLAPDHQWMTTRLRFRNPVGSWGEFMDLKGDQGATGLAPEHQWNSSSLRFRNPDGSWGSFSELEGPEGPQGEKGDKPQHQWSGTSIRFENPDGSFGPYIDIQGPQGNSVTVVGSVLTVADLPSGEDNNIGDMIIVSETGEGYVWTGTEWVNVGQVQGPPGEMGPTGPAPDHQWNQTSLRFRNPDGSWGNFTNLKGDKGDQGDQGDQGIQGIQGPEGPEGATGLSPEHQWNQTALRFRNPDGTWGNFTNLKGDKGDQGDQGATGAPGPQGEDGPEGPTGPQGDTGLAPEHQWNQTALRFRNPDGTWGSFSNLKGDKGDQGDQGIQGTQGEQGIQGIQGAQGEAGPPNTLSIGTVQSGPSAQALITGQAPNQTLNLVLPQGPAGTYTAGPGINIQNDMITNTGDTDPDPKVKLTTTFGGDIGGVYNDISVNRLRGRLINNSAPVEGNVLTWSNGQWRPQEPQSSSSTLSGDVTGASGNNTVEKIRGITVTSTTPTEGQVLTFGNGAWRPTNIPSTAGDVVGNLNQTRVQRIQGTNVANTAPVEGQLMGFANGSWRPTNIPNTTGGDLSGAYTNASVVGLRNNPLANEAPQNGDVLQYLDGAWRPTAPVNNGDDSGKVYAGAVNQFGVQSYVSDPNMTVTVEGGVIIVSIAGVNLNGNNCSAVAIGRNNLNFYFRVTFLSGTARFAINEPGVDPYPMNFMIFR